MVSCTCVQLCVGAAGYPVHIIRKTLLFPISLVNKLILSWEYTEDTVSDCLR